MQTMCYLLVVHHGNYSCAWQNNLVQFPCDTAIFVSLRRSGFRLDIGSNCALSSLHTHHNTLVLLGLSLFHLFFFSSSLLASGEQRDRLWVHRSQCRRGLDCPLPRLNSLDSLMSDDAHQCHQQHHRHCQSAPLQDPSGSHSVCTHSPSLDSMLSRCQRHTCRRWSG